MAEIKKVNHWHERLAEALIMRPDVSMSTLAKEFNVTAPWLSTVKNSDAFQQFFRSMSDKHASALLTSVQEKAAAAAELAIDEIQGRLIRDASVIPIGTLLETADVMLKRALPAGGAPQVNISVGTLTKEELAEIRAGLRAPKTVEGQVVELKAIK